MWYKTVPPRCTINVADSINLKIPGLEGFSAYKPAKALFTTGLALHFRTEVTLHRPGICMLSGLGQL
jgi:hypothetical protein